MFLLRSAFWLTVGFVLVHPHDVDLGATANAISGRAMDAGRQIVAQQIIESAALPQALAAKAISNDCALLGCAPAKPAPRATAAASLQNQPAGRPMQDSPASVPAPFPRPRPGWLG
jgi:hypothetical protein